MSNSPTKAYNLSAETTWILP